MNKHLGSDMRSLFDELEETEALDALTQKKLIVEQLRARMECTQMTSAALAKAMKTSRSTVHRLLDPAEKGVTLETLASASHALGLEFTVSFRAKGAPKKAAPKARASATRKSA